MTIQEAAHQLLKEHQRPLDSKTIAKLALDRGLVTSSARDPIASLAQTIEKNIRDDVYNRHQLVFVQEGRQRLIGLLGSKAEVKPLLSRPLSSGTGSQQLSVRIPGELMDQIRLAERAKIETNFDDTVTALLREGLKVVAPRIKEAIESQLRELPAA